MAIDPGDINACHPSSKACCANEETKFPESKCGRSTNVVRRGHWWYDRSPTSARGAVESSIHTYWPSMEYLSESLNHSYQRMCDQQILVLDLNGTLAYRKSHESSDQSIANVVGRPHLQEFLVYIFRNFQVVIWTTLTRKSAEVLMQATFSLTQRRNIRFIWTRESMGLSKAEFHSDVPVVKDLDKLWTSAPGIKWRACQKNTILVDDEIANACRQPFNLVSVGKWCSTADSKDRKLGLLDAQNVLEILRQQPNVSAYIRSLVRRRSI